MIASEIQAGNTHQEITGTILWLTGWSIPDTVFNRLQALLPDFHHHSVDYSAADSPEEMLILIETAAVHVRSSNGPSSRARAIDSPLLIGGWSLGGLLALKLAGKGYADGLVLFAATARFTRAKEESDLGWADAFVRQMITGIMKDRLGVEAKFRQNMLTEEEWEAGQGKSLPQEGSWTTPALIAGLQILRSEDCVPQLPEILCPVLLIHGTADKICPYGAASELAARLPQASLLSMPGCGHAPFMEREAFIADKMRRWWHEQQDSASI
ncbi:alpha/beta hydrolase [Paenibacillus solisilvae]|uniref:Alpha/beta hydrolase n=1 Tax=Paenibacillus solisilvae TaxID=2486751 RepID=A0ABW0W0L4_9BACL